jgi:hypothetical protein
LEEFLGEIFLQYFPPRPKTLEEKIPFPLALSRILEEFFSLIKILYHLFLIGFDIMAEENKEIDERKLLVLLPIMLLQKTFEFLSHWDL